MRIPVYIRFTISLVLLFCLTSPVAVLAMGDGKKHFKQGMKYEEAEQWDKAVEEFALAIVENPKNVEYRLHYQRSLFNASQMFMKAANALVEQKDYSGAYNAFRKAYAFDPANELAKAEMNRMLRLQESLNNPDQKDENTDSAKTPGVRLVQTAFKKGSYDDTIPQRLEKLRDIPFPTGVDIQFLIRELAKDLDLNVLFDEESFRGERKVKIELKNVTAAKALDYLFMQTGLFFQKVGPRTIIVANQNRRQNFQQLILKTFYLANADPQDVSKVIQTAIPPQPGRTPTGVLTDKATNSLTVRDTAENVSLIGKLIKSLDKDRSEVVMDVNIFEVSKSDLLRFGNQVGNGGSLGGSSQTQVGISGTDKILSTIIKDVPSKIFGSALFLPSFDLQAFQSRGNTKLLASTQVHAFNNEESTARIGQRVPVQTASVIPFSGGNSGGNGGAFGGNGFPVINYEQVGLTLKFTPIVFPNQDVQVKMEIESKDVVIAAGKELTPSFTERSIKGTARIQNNRTLLLASVAQGSERNGRSGLPLVSMIPFLGRLFTAPQRDNSQVDIVIAVTPKVLRAPVVFEEDMVERPTGSLATPTSGSLEAMIIQEEYEEQLAAARRISNTATIQVVNKEEAPKYVSSGSVISPSEPAKSADPASDGATASNPAGNTVAVSNPAEPKSEPNRVEMKAEPAKEPVKALEAPTILKAIDSAPRTLNITQTSDTQEKPAIEEPKASIVPKAELSLFSFGKTPLKAGEKVKISVLVNSVGSFSTATMGLGYDPKKVSIKKITFGEVFGAAFADKEAPPYFNSKGKLYVTMTADKTIKIDSDDVLAYIEVEALEEGVPELSFIENMFSLINEDGQNFLLSFGK